MDFKELVEKATDSVSVERVFGEPVERDGVTVIPVARIAGGGGGGGGGGGTAGGPEGGGGGLGLKVSPVGVYVIKNGEVGWVPVVDVRRLVLGGQIIAGIGLLVVWAIVRGRAKTRRQKG
ncbi:spore germination protein GerW family protein [Sphaerisporangium aureirubrum]|uniref:Spore germination protein GerW family protein n=1 Tax=Sphaerisporangium aureirubrum TaxID=1544736 RepID=A0ABW1NGL2_9ACTN